MKTKEDKIKKIHCIDAKENSTFDELRKMVGWIEPNNNGKTWDVTLIEGGFECKSQEIAQIIGSVEEIKSLLMKLVKK